MRKWLFWMVVASGYERMSINLLWLKRGYFERVCFTAKAFKAFALLGFVRT